MLIHITNAYSHYKCLCLFGTTQEFKGRIKAINLNAPHDKGIRVLYEDGDEMDLTQVKLDSYSAEASIAIGDEGFRFIKKFGRHGYFSGKVISFQDNETQFV